MDIDIETILYAQLLKSSRLEAMLTRNQKDRVVLTINHDGVDYEFIAVGNGFVPRPPKPPTQVCAPIGVDVSGAYGAR
jgi:hypothetical protein